MSLKKDWQAQEMINKEAATIALLLERVAALERRTCARMALGLCQNLHGRAAGYFVAALQHPCLESSPDLMQRSSRAHSLA